jgi:hypothetical protein
MLESRLPPLTYRRHTYGTRRNYHRKNQFRLMLVGPTFTTGLLGMPPLGAPAFRRPIHKALHLRAIFPG